MEYADIATIQLNDTNPRLIRDEKFIQLVQSIRDFPDMLAKRPIIVNQDRVVLGGNMRLRACREAGINPVPIIVVDWTEEQQREFIIKDNVSFGSWDWNAISGEWDADQIQDWGLDIPGFDNVPQSEDFTLPEGERAPYQQVSFSLSDTQAETLRHAIAIIKESDAYTDVETFGNENSNGNALYLLALQWLNLQS